MLKGARKRGTERRIGARVLALLGTPPNAAVVECLAEGGAMGLADLQVRAGSPGSTLRMRLRQLSKAGVVAQRSAGVSGSSSEYELTAAGEELHSLAETLERWLDEAPGGSRTLGGDRAKAAIGALTEGWSAGILRALAARPLSIAELDELIGGLNYPSLERRVAAMRLAGQVEARTTGGRETPYAVTDWLRRAAGPLLAAIRWERRHSSGAVPPAGMDVEAVFLLAMPLLTLEGVGSATCRLAVELSSNGNGRQRLAGALVEFRGGTLTSCTSRLDGEASAWSSGSLAAWLNALVDDDGASLELGGDGRLAHNVVSGLHRALFAHAARAGEEIAA